MGLWGGEVGLEKHATPPPKKKVTSKISALTCFLFFNPRSLPCVINVENLLEAVLPGSYTGWGLFINYVSQFEGRGWSFVLCQDVRPKAKRCYGGAGGIS